MAAAETLLKRKKNMKFSNIDTVKKGLLLASLAALCLLPSAFAQTDTFRGPISIIPSGSPYIVAPADTVVTNGPIDIGGYVGTANVDVAVTTNAAANNSFQIFTSMDQT